MKSESLGSSAVVLTASKIITLCLTMVTTMLLSRFRTFQEYGTYSELLLIVNLTSTLLMLGLPNSINFFLAKAETQDEQKKFLSIYYTLSTMLSILIGIVLVLLVPLLEKYFHNSAIKAFSYFLAVYPWTAIISSSLENLLIVYQHTKGLMLFKATHSAAQLLTAIIVQILGYGFSTYLFLFVTVNCGFAVSAYVIASRLCGGICLCFDRAQLKEVFFFSIPIGLATAVGTLNTEIDKLLIGYLMNTEQLAVYTNAAKELPLTVVPSSITAVLLPRLTRMIKENRDEDAVRLWNCASELSFIIISFLVAGVFTYAEDAMTILYSSKYLSGITVFRIYTLNLLLRVTYFGIILNAYGDTKKILYCSVLSLLLNSFLNPLFYRFWGMMGPAVATFIALLLIALLQLHMTAQKTKLALSILFPWRQALRILILNSALGFCFWALKYFLPLDHLIGNLQETITLAVVWTLIYVFCVKDRILCLWETLNAGGKQSANI